PHVVARFSWHHQFRLIPRYRSPTTGCTFDIVFVFFVAGGGAEEAVDEPDAAHDEAHRRDGAHGLRRVDVRLLHLVGRTRLVGTVLVERRRLADRQGAGDAAHHEPDAAERE